MTTLAEYQRGFAAALLADDAPLAAMPGFAVYRNTLMKACVDALEANFPAVTRLVGEEWMRAAATRYVHGALPAGPMLLDYGSTFPEFLAAFEPAASLPWLPDVARLDRLWIEAHMAADAEPMDASRFAAIDPSAMLDVRVQPHPSARWCWCEHSPAHTIWSRNRAEHVDEAQIEWQPEGTLVTRPQEVVLYRPLGPAGIAFMDACATGASLGEATLAALDAEPGAAVPALIASLLEAGALSALLPASRFESHQDPQPDPHPDPRPTRSEQRNP